MRPKPKKLETLIPKSSLRAFIKFLENRGWETRHMSSGSSVLMAFPPYIEGHRKSPLMVNIVRAHPNHYKINERYGTIARHFLNCSKVEKDFLIHMGEEDDTSTNSLSGR